MHQTLILLRRSPADRKVGRADVDTLDSSRTMKWGEYEIITIQKIKLKRFFKFHKKHHPTDVDVDIQDKSAEPSLARHPLLFEGMCWAYTEASV